MLDIVIYSGQPDTPKPIYRMFAEGLKRHGITPEFRRTEMYRRCDLAVFWAHKQTGIIQMQKEAGLDYLVLERGYFGDRFQMTSAGFNGLNGHAEFHAQGMPDDRWRKHGVDVHPWKEGGDYGLILGQVPGDASLKTCPNYPGWINAAAAKLREFYGLRVFFRSHPHPAASRLKPDIPHLRGTLDEALSGAAYVCLWNSNSGVDAALRGVPVIACDRGAMSYPVAAPMIGRRLVRPDREQWLNDLAYCQWTEEEIQRGDTWAHLRQRFDMRQTAAC